MISAYARDSFGQDYIFLFAKQQFQQGTFRTAHLGEIIFPLSCKGRKIVVKLRSREEIHHNVNKLMPDIAVSNDASKLSNEFNTTLKHHGINNITIEFCQPIIATLTQVPTESPV